MQAIRRWGLSSLLLFSSAVLADPVMHLEVKRGSTLAASGVATLVADGYLLTSLTLTSLGKELLVSPPGSSESFAARLVAQSETEDLALLQVSGLAGTPIRLAREMPERGRTLDVVGRDKRKQRGVLLSEPTAQQVAHSAMYGQNAFGSPLLNNCGELVGINRAQARGLLNRRLDAPSLPLRAASLSAITELLASADVMQEQASERCLSQEEMLDQAGTEARESAEEQQRLIELQEQINQRNAELERARLEIEAALTEQQRQLEQQRTTLDEAERSKEELEQEKQRLLEAAEAIREDKEQLESKQSELEAQRETLEQQLQSTQANLQHVIYAGLGLLGLLIIAFAVLRKRRKQLQQEQHLNALAREALDAASLTWQDILLSGEDPDGKTLRIKINGTALIRSNDGQIIGRHPASADYVINIPEVSREHLHLVIRDNRLMVVDLASRNGTHINGTRLEGNQPAELHDGDTLSLGTIELKVAFMDSAQ